MRRRIIWRYGDSPPIFGNLVAAVEGNGTLKVFVGFPVSAAEVAFSRIYNRYLIEQYGYDYEKYAFAPECYVQSVDDDGFTICYKNITDSLEVNYFVT
jgi:hypothetical protein